MHYQKKDSFTIKYIATSFSYKTRVSLVIEEVKYSFTIKTPYCFFKLLINKKVTFVDDCLYLQKFILGHTAWGEWGLSRGWYIVGGGWGLTRENRGHGPLLRIALSLQ